MNKLGTERIKSLIMLACWSSVCIWIAIVFYLSYQKGDQTTSLSLDIAEKIAKCFPRYTQKYSFEELHGRIRKAAHLFLFLTLGMLAETTVLISIRLIDDKYGWIAFMPAVVCTMIALITEVMKLYIPGRHLHWDEVVLNVTCSWCGIGMSMLICWIWQWVHGCKT